MRSLPHVGMVHAERFFADRQRTFEESLSLRVLGLGSINEGQVVESAPRRHEFTPSAFSRIASARLKSPSASVYLPCAQHTMPSLLSGGEVYVSGPCMLKPDRAQARLRSAAVPHSALMFAALMMGHHFSISDL